MSIRITWRNGVAQASGTVNGKRVRQSLGTGDPKRAAQAAAELEAKAWKESVYGADAVVSFEAAALSYMEAGGEGRYLARPLRHFKGVLLTSIKPGHIREAAQAHPPELLSINSAPTGHRPGRGGHQSRTSDGLVRRHHGQVQGRQDTRAQSC